MTSRGHLPLAGALLAASIALGSGPAGAQSTLTAGVPLGRYVRAGRPLGVRVSGPVLAVRAAGTPWALPQGAEGDEFLLDGVRPAGDRLTLFVLSGAAAAESTVEIPVRELPEHGEIVAVLDDSEIGPGEVRLRPGAGGLPTIAAAWLVFDDVRGIPAALPPPEMRAIDVERRSFRPLLLASSPLHFRAAGEAHRRVPALPPDVGLVLAILAVTEVVLVALTRSRAGSRSLVARTAWLAAPPLAVLGFLLVAARLPGPLATTVMVVGAEDGRLVIVRLEARRAGTARLILPQSASQPAVLRFGTDDGSEAGLWTGHREVRADLPAGATRLVGYRVPAARHPPDPGREPAPETLRWLGALGLEGTVVEGEDRDELLRDALPYGHGSRVVPSLVLHSRPTRRK